MKILHVWSNAGVAGILAKWQRKHGHEADVLTKVGHDPRGANAFYGAEQVGANFYSYALAKAKYYDVIHIHSTYKLVPQMRLRYPFKKIVIQYHGTDARKPDRFFRRLANLLADGILYGTPDLRVLLPGRAIYLPTPVDTDHFKPLASVTSDVWLAQQRAGRFETALPDVPQVGQVKLFDREAEPTPYKDMPAFLSQFGGYIDIKVVKGKRLEAMSKTGLEALWLGLPVMDYTGGILRGLPGIHDPEYSYHILESLYLKG